MTLLPPTFRLPTVEYLFKQSEMGGRKHIMINVEEYEEYIRKMDDTIVFRVETMCDKSLKFNPNYSVVKVTDGLVRGICEECVINYDSEERAEEAEARKARLKERYNDGLPF